MTATTVFRHVDSKRPDGCYVTFHAETVQDETADPNDTLFQDPAYKAEDQARLDAYNRGDWYFVGIRAVATIWIIKANVGTSYTLRSAGIWGMESDSSEDYFNETYEDEKATLLGDIKAMANPIVS